MRLASYIRCAGLFSALTLLAPAVHAGDTPNAAIDAAASNAQVYAYGYNAEMSQFSLWELPSAGGDFPATRLQFEGDTEVWALSEELGSGGDTIYRNDTGRIVLRVRLQGGVTLYPTSRSKGIAAALSTRAAKASVQSFQSKELQIEGAMQARLKPSSTPVLVAEAVADIAPEEVAYLGTPLRANGESLALLAEKRGTESDLKALRPDGLSRRDIEFTEVFRSKVDAALRRRPDADQSATYTVVVTQTQTPQVSFSDDTLTLGVNPAWGAAGQMSSERLDQILDSFRNP